MTTERDIVESCVCHKVRMAARAVTRAYDAALRPVGLRATQFAVLVAVATEGKVSVSPFSRVYTRKDRFPRQEVCHEILH